MVHWIMRNFVVMYNFIKHFTLEQVLLFDTQYYVQAYLLKCEERHLNL